MNALYCQDCHHIGGRRKGLEGNGRIHVISVSFSMPHRCLTGEETTWLPDLLTYMTDPQMTYMTDPQMQLSTVFDDYVFSTVVRTNRCISYLTLRLVCRGRLE